MLAQFETNQHTLKHAVHCEGVGLHTGRAVKLTLKPAPADSGICFRRTDLAGKPYIPARVDRIVDTRLATTIANASGEARISTTEHLLAALRAAGIDNVLAELNGHEVPIMDGSAEPFLHLIDQAGRTPQRALRRMLRVTKPISFSQEGKSIRIEPYAGFRISSRIHFDDELINEQRYSVELTSERFTREIASARTFGFVEQVEQLWQNGLALGGTLDNVIAIHWDRRSILNEEGLRFSDEFIRHKVLDLIGDLTLLGQPILGHVIADRSGHGLHYGLMQTLLNTPSCWEQVTCRPWGKEALSRLENRIGLSGKKRRLSFNGGLAEPACVL